MEENGEASSVFPLPQHYKGSNHGRKINNTVHRHIHADVFPQDTQTLAMHTRTNCQVDEAGVKLEDFQPNIHPREYPSLTPKHVNELIVST